MAIDFIELCPIIDRLLLISWLFKDMGWLTTNIWLGWPFGVVSIIGHLTILICDSRKTYRYYNFSMLLWVVGNFIWMTLEFVCIRLSTRIHLGPLTPLGGMDDRTQGALTDFKNVLFLISLITQLYMYYGIYANRVEMPKDDEIDDKATSDIRRILSLGKIGNAVEFGRVADRSSHSDDSQQHSHFNHDDLMNEDPPPFITISFISNGYIIFWVAKDLLWSFGTGDIMRGHTFVITCEALAMLFGCIAICVILFTTYICRRDSVNFFDNFTTVFWICANFIWMCGEFFVRYHSMGYDDENSRDDWGTRVFSLCFFSLGILLQIIVVSYLTFLYYKRKRGKNRQKTSIIEMRDLSVHSVSDVINRPTSSMNPLYSASKGESSNSSSSSASKNDDQHGVAFSPLPLHDIGNSGIYGDDCNDDDLSIIVL